MVTSRVRNSATGMAIHAPVIPIISGNKISDSDINTSVLQNDIIADIFPFDRAVKNPDDNILSPLNKKLMANSLNPDAARLKVSASSVKTVIIGVDNNMAATAITTDEAATNINEILYIFFSSLWFFAP